MPVARSHHLAFIHIPRTGGTSVMRAFRDAGIDFTLDGRGLWDLLREAAEPERIVTSVRETFRVNTIGRFAQQHLSARAVREIVGAGAWTSLFSFAVVRNPWDLLVSSYHFQRAFAESSAEGESETREIMGRCPTFADYVHLYPAIRSDMTAMIVDGDGSSLVTFIGRFERLTHDFSEVCARHGIEAELSRENASTRARYADYYTPRTQKLVARHFARDIDAFHYRF